MRMREALHLSQSPQEVACAMVGALSAVDVFQMKDLA